MNIQLIGALDWQKVDALLKEKIPHAEERSQLIEQLMQIETARRCEIVSAAGRLSRFPGDVLEILHLSEEKTLEQNKRYIEKVCGMGHSSITDHDYFVFAIKNVTPVIEQTIIAERFSSFTIKSRREVDFSEAGFYVPDFHHENGMLIEKNEEVKEEFSSYIKSLFQQYTNFLNRGIPKEDARFIFPYNFYSNIIMGVDAHALKEMLIKFTKTKYAQITELRTFGEKLYEIVEEHCPYILREIDKQPVIQKDAVDEYIEKTLPLTSYHIIEKPTLLNATEEVDETILLSAIMRRRGVGLEDALQLYAQAERKNPCFQNELMRKIAFEGDQEELAQVNFQFQLPLSFAVLTHLTRHRTHHILIPDFVPNIDLGQYKIPPKFEHDTDLKREYNDIFLMNQIMYDHFKNDYQIREEDLVYFTLSGNMVNVVTNLDGKTIAHILRLRECNKAQWETREMAKGMHDEIALLADAQNFSSILGATCMTKGVCYEGKESCGKLEAIQKGQERQFQYQKK